MRAVAALVGWWVLAGLWASPPAAAAGQIYPVEAPKSRPGPSTMTLLYGVDNPQTTVILIPGGEGHLRFNESTTGTRNQSALMLQNLTQEHFSKLRTNVVIFDSPQEIYPGHLRAEADHLDRIESVVSFYRNKFNTPIWLLGHSWGSVSVTEFLKRAEARSSIAGIITSGSKYEIEVPAGVSLPILFLHHERDGCKATPYSYARSNVEKTKTRNKGVTELATVRGGEHRGDPCRDGLHMYFGAYEEAARLVEQFISRNQPGGASR